MCIESWAAFIQEQTCFLFQQNVAAKYIMGLARSLLTVLPWANVLAFDATCFNSFVQKKILTAYCLKLRNVPLRKNKNTAEDSQ